ncbi:MAG: DNA-binding protein YbiB [Candidatus Accumulibacter sp.]|uniref:DNA-binding protein YbiB n=1 Tax=Candidatus Accumulibacter affinis TaxID=2954384 RepID=A0A935THK5_9PROT|nr:DNA-binding protein YbiB [Candidatus Accumulibacter affinis]MBP9804821.1 DNA-binding protein YbiB [Accumulibacter sp.]
MDFALFIREIGRGATGARNMSRAEAQQLYGAILDGAVPDLELGAIAIALRMKTETADEMVGFLAAAGERLSSLRRPHGRIRPVVIPTYNGARRGANLTPLLALLLQHFGVPVLLHGLSDDYGRVTSEQILREYGLPPSSSVPQAQLRIDEYGMAYLPLPLLSPGLDRQLALRRRLGLRNSAHSLVKMLDPFQGDALLLAAATHPDYLASMRTVLTSAGANALLLRGTEGEPFANPKRRPTIEHIHGGVSDLLFEAEHDSLRNLPQLPADCDAIATVAWMRRVLAGEVVLPQPIANQLACCLYACGRATDLHQAKALVAVESKGLALA